MRPMPGGVQVLYGAAAESSWREILYWVGPPGMVIGLLALLTLDEPRSVSKGFMDNLLASSRFLRVPGYASSTCLWLPHSVSEMFLAVHAGDCLAR